MDILDLLVSAASIVVGPLLILGPLLAYRWVFDTCAHWPPYGAGLIHVADVAGLILGVCLVATTPMPGQPLSVDSVFAVGGPWDFDLEQFGSLVLDRVGAAPDVLFDRLVADDERLNLAFPVWLALALVGGHAGVRLIRQEGVRLAALTLAMDIVITVLTAVLTLYACLLALWLLNRLNFWLFGVMILLIQEYRYSVFGLFPRHRHFRLPRIPLPLGAPTTGKARRR